MPFNSTILMTGEHSPPNTSVVQVQPPIFIIPGVLGNSSEIKALADELNRICDGQRAIYIFQDPRMVKDPALVADGAHQPYITSFASFAEQIKDLADQLPTPAPYVDYPIMLVGYSYGAVLAYEAMKLLREKKYDVHLFLIDSLAPSFSKAYFTGEGEKAIDPTQVLINIAHYATVLSMLTPKCEIATIFSHPQKEKLDALPIKANTAFLRCGNKLFYVNKAFKQCTEITNDRETLTQFDRWFEPYRKRMLTDGEQNKIISLIGAPPFEFDQALVASIAQKPFLERIQLIADIVLKAGPYNKESVEDFKSYISVATANLKNIVEYDDTNLQQLGKLNLLLTLETAKKCSDPKGGWETLANNVTLICPEELQTVKHTQLLAAGLNSKLIAQEIQKRFSQEVENDEVLERQVKDFTDQNPTANWEKIFDNILNILKQQPKQRTRLQSDETLSPNSNTPPMSMARTKTNDSDHTSASPLLETSPQTTVMQTEDSSEAIQSAWLKDKKETVKHQLGIFSPNTNTTKGGSDSELTANHYHTRKKNKEEKERLRTPSPHTQTRSPSRA